MARFRNIRVAGPIVLNAEQGQALEQRSRARSLPARLVERSRIVLCVDEKTQIQALDRTQPGPPLKRGRGATITHDYKRNGTTTVFAALNAANGTAISLCQERHRHKEWLRRFALSVHELLKEASAPAPDRRGRLSPRSRGRLIEWVLSLAMVETALTGLESGAHERIRAAATVEELERVRVEVLGRKGTLAEISKGLGKLAPEERAAAGRLLNAVKQALEEALEARRAEFREAAAGARFAAEWIDFTLLAPPPARGHLHPISRIQAEIEDVFTSLGFTVMDGPEVETEYHNFDALNIPPDHPARDMQDTFWLAGGSLLRTHTSPVQVRGMERFGPPLRMIAPGRVFRNEEVDASHEHTFYQLEGMMVDREVSVAHLVYFMQTLLNAVFKREVTVRLRPGYFPFVEPGFELDIHCLICGGRGCPVCKQGGWVELLPCGLVHPNVLRLSGIDSEEWSGFAFGLGLTRLVMMRYAIDDIRLLQGGDLRFLNQF